MPISGPAVGFHQAHKFFVEIEGVRRLSVKNISELGTESADIEHYEGGTDIPHKVPGRKSYDDLTLERGVQTGDFDFYEWYLETGNPAISAIQGPGIGRGVGLGNQGYKRNLDIVQIDTDGAELRRYRIFNAYPKRCVVGSWDNDADEIVIEQIVLRYDFFERIA